MVKKADPKSLVYHVDAVKKGERVFEDAFQGVSRMILDAGIGKVTVKGRTTYQFDLFSQGKKHLVGMYDEINSFVSFVKDASEGGSSREMAYVLVGEPGNGKIFFILVNLVGEMNPAAGHPGKRPASQVKPVWVVGV